MIDALTAPPVGVTPYDYAIKILGDKLVFTTSLNVAIFQNPFVTPNDIREERR